MFRFAKILNWWLPDFSCSPDELIVPCTELNDIIGGTDNRCALARLRTLGRGGAREEKSGATVGRWWWWWRADMNSS